MPRTSTIDSPGCPPFRAFTFDALGPIKVVEARDQPAGVARVVERWGDPDSSNSVSAASITHRNYHPLLALARKNGLVEVLNPVNLQAGIVKFNDTDMCSEENAIVGLHVFSKQNLELASRSCTLLTCTTKGNVNVKSFDVTNSSSKSAPLNSSTWSVCSSGNISCCKVDGSEEFALFGGKGVEVNFWDLDKSKKIWNAKPPPKNSLGIFTPTWNTCSTFLSKHDNRKFVAGTNSHQVHLYDISAQRRPVISFDFRETPIKAVAEDIDGYSIYVGNGSGDLASVDMRTGKLLGCFTGKCSGSIRSIVRHPELPIIASCGLDAYLRIWDTKTRQLLSAVFLKQHLMQAVFDCNFICEEKQLTNEKQQAKDDMLGEELDSLPLKRKKSESKETTMDTKDSKKKSKKSKNHKKVREDSPSEKITRDGVSKSNSKKKSKSKSKLEVLDDGF